MSVDALQTLEPVSPLRQQRRFTLRRDRILPGPLKALPRRRAASWQVSFAIATGLILAAGSTVVYLSTRPANGIASTSTERPDVVVASVAAEQPREIPMTAPASVAPEPAMTETQVVSRPLAQVEVRPPVEAPPTSGRPVADKAAFQLDSLPVLQADEASFGVDPANVPDTISPAVRTPKAAPRRSTASAGRPAQPRSPAMLPAGQ